MTFVLVPDDFLCRHPHGSRYPIPFENGERGFGRGSPEEEKKAESCVQKVSDQFLDHGMDGRVPCLFLALDRETEQEVEVMVWHCCCCDFD